MVRLASLVALAAGASAAAINRRDVSTILANLEAIDSSTNSLTSTVTSWDGSLLGALTINTAAGTLESQIEAANTEAETEAVSSSADSQTIIAYITGTATPDIAASLTALIAREADFASLGITSLVLNTLETLQADNDALGATLVSITSSDQVANAEAALAVIDADFTAAIAAFS
ncbi:hydrophobic surface binding protein A-domain-containing protein [Xylariales sp. PMI_506]|nr:hydrophobic surface binding protein A-domain-containing protein [Xylariales sp. PMI_506]